jgi:tetratricopeptide (TPR) repeat protein
MTRSQTFLTAAARPFPHDAEPYLYKPAALKKLWSRLHRGDMEPLPATTAAIKAWQHFHAGQYQQAARLGLALGLAGLSIANKSQAMYATYLEPDQAARIRHFDDVVERAGEHIRQAPEDPNAHYWLAYALGRRSQALSVAEALAQGVGERVKQALETTIDLSPRHADAHIALATFHAEVVDKAGRLLAKALGADAATSLHLYETALTLNPGSAVARTEYANALVMLEGARRLQQAEGLYAEAAACEAMDATERLDVQAARDEIDA